jgi:hypothetical protein
VVAGGPASRIGYGTGPIPVIETNALVAPSNPDVVSREEITARRRDRPGTTFQGIVARPFVSRVVETRRQDCRFGLYNDSSTRRAAAAGVTRARRLTVVPVFARLVDDVRTTLGLT